MNKQDYESKASDAFNMYKTGRKLEALEIWMECLKSNWNDKIEKNIMRIAKSLNLIENATYVLHVFKNKSSLTDQSSDSLKNLRLRVHPDKNTFPCAKDAFIIINNAYEQLKNKFDNQENSNQSNVNTSTNSCNNSSTPHHTPNKKKYSRFYSNPSPNKQASNPFKERSKSPFSTKKKVFKSNTYFKENDSKYTYDTSFYEDNINVSKDEAFKYSNKTKCTPRHNQYNEEYKTRNETNENNSQFSTNYSDKENREYHQSKHSNERTEYKSSFLINSLNTNNIKLERQLKEQQIQIERLSKLLEERNNKIDVLQKQNEIKEGEIQLKDKLIAKLRLSLDEVTDLIGGSYRE